MTIDMFFVMNNPARFRPGQTPVALVPASRGPNCLAGQFLGNDTGFSRQKP